MQRRTPLRRSNRGLSHNTPLPRTGPLTTPPATVRAWQQRARDTAAAKPGRRAGSTLPDIGPAGRRATADADQVRPHVRDRDQGRCRYPHHLMPVACSAPHGLRRTADGWEQDPANPGRIDLCHVIPSPLAGDRRWHPDNLFCGCDAGNNWQETDTAAALALGVHAHWWEHVANGRRITP